MSIYKLLSVALIATFLPACTARLIVKDKDGNETHGVPFRAPVMYVFSGEFTKHSEGENCAPTPFSDTHALPLGDLYYATVKTGELAGSEFTIEFTEQGTLKKISLNSDTTVDDVTSGIAVLLDKASPLLAPTPTSSEALEKNLILPCDTGKEIKRVEAFEDFMKRLAP